MTSNSIDLFQSQDLFEVATHSLSSADVCHLALVCKSWATAADMPGIWRQHFIRELIPFVEGDNRDYKADFKTLYPMTLSGRKIEKYFGQFIGKIPDLSLSWYQKLSQPDPFEPEKTFADNYVLIVEPQSIKRTFSKDCSAVLDDKGNLTVSLRVTAEETDSATETDVEIPFTLANLKTLTYCPLSGKKNLPAFYYGNDQAAFAKGAPGPTKVNLYFMRKESVRRTLSKNPLWQKQFLEKEGFQMTPLKPRVLLNTIQILDSGACLDGENSYVCTADHGTLCGRAIPFIIGRFAAGRGLKVIYKNDGFSHGAVPVADVGAVPVCAESS